MSDYEQKRFFGLVAWYGTGLCLLLAGLYDGGVQWGAVLWILSVGAPAVTFVSLLTLADVVDAKAPPPDDDIPIRDWYG